MKIEHININQLKFDERNPRIIDKDEFAGLVSSIKTFGLVDPVIINHDNTIIGGHQRTRAAQAAGLIDVPCIRLNLDEHDKIKLNVLLNSQAISGRYDELKLEEILDELKFDQDYLELRLDKLEIKDLDTERLISPSGTKLMPESVIDGRKLDWIKSDELWAESGVDTGERSPTLYQTLYEWFCPQGGLIMHLNPTNGAPGLVAAKNGYNFIGLQANDADLEAEAGEILTPNDGGLAYVNGDITGYFIDHPDKTVDLVLYDMNTEDKHSDLLLSDLAKKMKPNRFIIAIGNYERVDVKNGGAINDVPYLTKKYIDDYNGQIDLYNHIIFIENTDTSKYAAKNFNNVRKVARIHTDVMVYTNGDPDKAIDDFAVIDFSTDEK